ncbi:MAG TPA: hypothetical protein VFV99_12015 [Kofleriaceae bacterium]|nr:hypothetical protein [Kofleriaceae bacterium]
MKHSWLALLAACGGDGGGGGPGLTATTSFVVTSVTGAGMSPLDPLAMQTIEMQIVFPDFAVDRGYEGDTTDCKSTMLWTFPAERTASGASAQLVQTQILDMLAYWDVRLQLCMTGKSSILLHSEIDVLNLAFGCFGIPASAQVRNADGYPEMTSFTATECSATILDVVNNRIVSNPSFSIDFALGQ